MSRVEAKPEQAALSMLDEAAFADLVEGCRRELQVHCYRMLGSFEDSEDLVQETFLRAWRKRDTYQGRSTVRAWLYRIATNACLDFLARNPRQPVPRPAETNAAGVTQRPPDEISWLQPYPDHLLEPQAPSDAEPDALVVAKETIELAFLVAIQYLPPKQRAVLILTDVLGWPASETAALLEVSVASVNSALQRARATLKERLSPRRMEWAPSVDPSEAERALLQRYMAVVETIDTRAMAELLREDVKVTMPPHPIYILGRDNLVAGLNQFLDPNSPAHFGPWRSIPTRANRQPAVAHYVRRPGEHEYRPQVLDVLTIEDGLVAEITSFGPDLFPAFGLPATLPS
ncbi:MAG TPA: sigma-70 family RNA polymerase sigma factor [Micromonosporaceae bacterium]